MRDPEDMNVEVLVVPDCPHAESAAARVRQVLAELGLDGVEVTARVITDQNQAERTGFTGSPTILINGHDPFAEPGRPAGPACRMYRTPDGLSGLPQPSPAQAGTDPWLDLRRHHHRLRHEGKHDP